MPFYNPFTEKKLKAVAPLFQLKMFSVTQRDNLLLHTWFSKLGLHVKVDFGVTATEVYVWPAIGGIGKIVKVG